MEDRTAKHGKLWRWLDERIGLKDIEDLAKKKEVPVHRHTVWYYFGGMTLFLFMIQVTTGILLLLYYRPSAGEAYESIQFLMTEVQFAGYKIDPRLVGELDDLRHVHSPLQRVAAEGLSVSARIDLAIRWRINGLESRVWLYRISLAVE
jgi:hypothetical protein